ncbi:MAG: LuxR family transcriptional regulator, partial [Actinomycetota bacterium]
MAPDADQGAYSAGRWQVIHDRLAALPDDQLTAADLGELAASLFWLNRPRASIEAHRRAFRQWQIEEQPERAVRSAWHLFYEHWLVGEEVVARGWLERARRLVATDPALAGSAADAWLGVARADVAMAEGRLDEAVGEATAARGIGERLGDADLVAMALQAEGRALVAAGRGPDGLARLDDAMVSVIGNELQPLFTGWVYCNVLSTCHAVGDLRRAGEWSTAARRWCQSLREGLLYPGLCRVYTAQLAQLRGDWRSAERDARQACEDLAAYDQRYAGAAHYVVGEICLLQGRDDEAAAAFTRSAELGHRSEPGRAL